jgi:hypothetical protein
VELLVLRERRPARYQQQQQQQQQQGQQQHITLQITSSDVGYFTAPVA